MRELKPQYQNNKEIIVAVGSDLFTLNGEERETPIATAVGLPEGKKKVSKLTAAQIELAFDKDAPPQLAKLRRFFVDGDDDKNPLSAFLKAGKKSVGTQSSSRPK